MEIDQAAPSTHSPQAVLVQWANEQESWIRILVKEVLARQGPVDDSVVEESFETLLREHGLSESAASVNVPLLTEGAPAAGSETSMTLDRMTDVIGVNALAGGQTIEFAKHLTVLFGQNGSGKTGYARIIKRAAKSRTHEELLGNVASGSILDGPRARFELTVDGKSQTLDWSNEVGIAPLDRIRVFDGQTASLHIDNDLGYIFTPAELVRFTDVTDAIRAVQERIAQENSLRLHASRLSADPFTLGTRAHTLVQNLGPATSLEDLRNLATVDEDDEDRLQQTLTEYASLKSGTASALRVGVLRQLADLDDLIEILTALQSFDAVKYNKALASVAEASVAVTHLRTALFGAAQLALESDEAWQHFIEAGQTYAEHLDLNQYPQEHDVCLYCRQPLGDDALALLRRYGEFLQEAAQSKLHTERQILENRIPILTLDQIRRSRGALSTVDDTCDPRQSAAQLLGDVQLALQLIEIRQACTDLSLTQRSNELKSPIEDLRTQLSAEEQLLANQQANQEKLLPELRRVADDIEDRIRLGSNLGQIEECVANAARAQRLTALDQAISGRVRRSLTGASKRASEDLVNRDFEHRFADECAALDAPAVALGFQGRHGSAERKKLVFDHRPSEVLSEGEQKVLALADFLAESCMNDSKDPIVFDDPVSSLDYRRLELVAARIARLAKDRQVIVLTHNIMFAAELLDHRQRNSDRTQFMQVRESLSEKGLVSPDVEPRLDKPGKLATRVDDAIRRASEASPSSQDDLIASAYDLMRSWCEAFVEQELLSNVSQRYRANIMMTRLDKIKVDRLSDAITILAPAFERICGYISGHSTPLEQQNISRTSVELQRDWAELKLVREEYVTE